MEDQELLAQLLWEYRQENPGEEEESSPASPDNNMDINEDNSDNSDSSDDISEGNEEDPFERPTIKWTGDGMRIIVAKSEHLRFYQRHLDDIKYKVSLEPVDARNPPTINTLFSAHCGFRNALEEVLKNLQDHFPDPHNRVIFVTVCAVGLNKGKRSTVRI